MIGLISVRRVLQNPQIYHAEDRTLLIAIALAYVESRKLDANADVPTHDILPSGAILSIQQFPLVVSMISV